MSRGHHRALGGARGQSPRKLLKFSLLKPSNCKTYNKLEIKQDSLQNNAVFLGGGNSKVASTGLPKGPWWDSRALRVKLTKTLKLQIIHNKQIKQDILQSYTVNAHFFFSGAVG